MTDIVPVAASPVEPPRFDADVQEQVIRIFGVGLLALGRGRGPRPTIEETPQ